MKASTKKALGIIGGILGVGGLIGLLHLTAEARGEVQLYTGWNMVTYYGKPQKAIEAFASIISYITIVHYWNAETQQYEQVLADTIMKTGASYAVGVTQDCIWRY